MRRIGKRIFPIILVCFFGQINCVFSYDSLIEKEVFDLYHQLDKNFPNTKDFLSFDEMKAVFKDAASHPVASLKVLGKYDPKGQIGFCFGRAMTTHFLSRQLGLKTQSILKMFIIGDLRQKGATRTEWRFHVTTLVKGKDEKNKMIKWFAIDPIMDGILPESQDRVILGSRWIEVVKNGWDSWGNPKNRKRARFFVATPDVVLPDLRFFKTNPKDEKGDQIIDFNFNPTDHDLTRSLLDRKPVYLLDSKTNDLEKANYDLAAKYFMSLIENEHDRFHMDSLDVSGENFTFANYFSHLMQTFLPEHIGPNDGRGVSETDENILPVIENAIEDNALGSMKILELLEK